MTCPHIRGLGVYVLGSQDTERSAAERHVASCAECRAELAALQGLPALLATVRDAGIVVDEEPVRPSDALLDRVLVTIAAERARTRGRRRRFVVLAAVAALTVTVAAGAGVTVNAWQWPEHVPVAAGRSPFGVSATTSVRGQPWGTEVDMRLSGLPAGSSCQLVAHGRTGHTETVASWRVTYQDSMTVEGMTSIAPDDLSELEVVDDNGRRLISVAVTSAGGTSR